MLRVRVAAIIIKNNKVLFVKHKKNSEEYYLLPGGGLEFFEKARDCVKREVKEETGLDIKAEELVFTGESFSPDKKRHILSLYFKGNIKKNSKLAKSIDKRVISADFFNVDEILELKIYPDIKEELITYLKFPEKHIIDHLEKKWI